MPCDFDNALEQHDSVIAGTGQDIWIGSEPTFTLRSSEEKHWLSQALGGDKMAYAMQIARSLYLRHPGSIILRTVGRQYDNEELPRWSFGLYERRDAIPVWNGPADPMCVSLGITETNQLASFLAALKANLQRQQWNYQFLPTPGGLDGGPDEARLVLRFDDSVFGRIVEADTQQTGCSVHDEKTPKTGLFDSLASEGYYQFVIKETQTSEEPSPVCVELPDVKDVNDFLSCLSLFDIAAKEAGLDQLQFQGYPPPVDHSVSWTTITPDPAVIEINQAPHPDIRRFHAASRELFEITDELGLSPYRLHYNGNITDSGGGGQFTLGGRTPQTSPFLTNPQLLPRLIRYFCLHPCFSYLFATDYVGSASQSPRVDENTRNSFRELDIALERLNRQTDCEAEFLWSSLAPFLADSSGNSHRSELNIEKLWNPYLPLRGCLGLLEFRAFRMPSSPERSTAIALLLRATTAMLCEYDLAPQLKDWGDELHDRFALPLFLQQDLNSVLADLEKTGFDLAPCIKTELLSSPDRPSWSIDFNGCRISIEKAIEFWPLVGDSASQETGGSRLVDSSTQRLQISLRQQDGSDTSLADWQLQTSEVITPFRIVSDDSGDHGVTALRYRDFVPWRGLHPFVNPTTPVTLYLSHPAHDQGIRISIHNWRVDSTPYDGLPGNLDEAEKRRDERLVVQIVQSGEIPPATLNPALVTDDFTIDLRRL